MATAANTKSKTSRKTRVSGSTATLKRWGVRALVALVLGGSLGAGAGILTVNKLEPGRGTGVDSLAVMLDSIATGAVPAADGDKRAPQGDDDPSASDDAPPPAAALVAVPSLVALEEGAARNALLDAGLQVGEIQFQQSPQPAGTVLATIPIAGANVPPNTAVTLVLSDGRPDLPDSLTREAPLPDSLGSGSAVDPDTSSRPLRPTRP